MNGEISEPFTAFLHFPSHILSATVQKKVTYDMSRKQFEEV